MSASREKKIRQEQAAAGHIDPKVEREAKRRAEQRRTSVLYGCIAAAFVIAAAFILLWNSNIIQRGAAAYTIGEETYTAADVDFYTHAIYNEYYANYGSYASSFFTADSLLEQALERMHNTVALAAKAINAGYEFTDEMRQHVDDTLATIDGYAATNGYSRAKYLKMVYGPLMTEEVFLRHTTFAEYAAVYTDDYTSSLDYSEEDFAAAYAENPADYDSVDIEFILFSAMVESADTADAEIEAAMEEAKKKAEEAQLHYAAGESLEAIAEELGGEYSHSPYTSSGTSEMLTWAFADERMPGDVTVVKYSDKGGYYLVVFHSRARNDYHSVDVRHILINVENGDDAAALAKAEELLADWEKNGASEEYFAELADSNSADTATVGIGGLYASVSRGQMVDEFEAWCFDEARAAGDTGIVYDSTYDGYHVMYFVGENDLPYWQEKLTTELTAADYDEWLASVKAEYPAQKESGIKYATKLV